MAQSRLQMASGLVAMLSTRVKTDTIYKGIVRERVLQMEHRLSGMEARLYAKPKVRQTIQNFQMFWIMTIMRQKHNYKLFMVKTKILKIQCCVYLVILENTIFTLSILFSPLVLKLILLYYMYLFIFQSPTEKR